jgi:hypothetical protein
MTVVSGRFETDHRWTEVDFEYGGAQAPVVIASITSFDGPDPAGVRLRNVTTGGMEAKIEEESGGGDPETRHVREAVRYVGFEPGAIEDASGSVIGEADSITRDQPDRDSWHTIDLERSYSDPVVFAQVASHNGGHPCHARVRDVRADRFELQIEEWAAVDGPHTEERLDVVVLERGVHELPDGSPLAVSTVEADDGWTNDIGFHAAFGREPAVVSRTQTFNGHHEVVTRHRNLDQDGIDLRLQEETGRSGGHTTETVGLLATPRRDVALGFGRVEGVSHAWHEFDYESRVEDPVVLTAIETFNGSDTAATRLREVTPTGAEVKIEEEQSGGDQETAHNDETVGVVVARDGGLWDEAGSRIGEAGSLRTDQPDRNTWHDIDFGERYSDPVVFPQLMSYEGGQPAHIRLRNVGPTGCQFKIEEWDYLNGPHTTETVGYLVVESGVHTLPDGAELHVGTVHSDDSWGASVSLLPDYRSSQPTALAHCQTANGGHEVVTRIGELSDDGFDVRLQEEKGRDGNHTTETVGFLGIARPGRTVSEYRVRLEMDSAVPGFTVQGCGFKFRNSDQFGGGYTVPDAVPLIDEIGDASNGMCGGMVYAAADYFVAGDSPWSEAELNDPPEDSPVSTEVPDEGTPLFDFLSERLFDSFLPTDANPKGALRYKRLMNVPSTGGARKSRNAVMNEHWHDHIKPALDDGRLCPLGLIHVNTHGQPFDMGLDRIGDNHQVLAYGYKQSGNRVEIYVYDPNRPEGDDAHIEFTHHGDLMNWFAPNYPGGRDLFGFFAVGYSPKDPPDF